MDVDQHVVVHDLGFVARDEADTAHVRGKVVDQVDVLAGCETVFPATQIESFELLSDRGFEFRFPDVDAAHPVAVFNQCVHQVMPNESACAGDKYALHVLHDPTPVGSGFGGRRHCLAKAQRNLGL